MTNNIKLIRELINALDADSVQDEVIKKTALALLDQMDDEPRKPKPAEPKHDEPKPKKKGRPAFDVGKMNALLKAGWSVPKIADEMGVSAPTVRKYMREEGYKC